MRNKKREKLKTYILTILIITSILQIGIHWNIQTQGLPFPFFQRVFSENERKGPKLNIDLFKGQYFKPKNIIVSVSTTHFRLYESDSQFEKAWNDVRDNYIPAMIKQKPDRVLPKEEWPALIGSRCVRIDFDINWPSSIVYLLEETNPGETKGFEGIKSIAIMPKADVNETVNTVYIYDEVQIYKYSINIEKDFMPKNFYSELESVSNRKPGLRLLSVVSNFYSDEEIYVSLDREKGRDFDTVSAEIPAEIALSRYNMENDLIQENILLNQKESFSANYLDGKDSALFTDTENLYKLYKNGFLEYKYIPVNAAPAGDIFNAFKHAVTFIEQRRHLIGEVDILLTAIKPMGNYYEMQFDYKVNGLTLYYSTNPEARITSPIIIKANEARILECKWAIRYFGVSNNSKSYNVDFADLLNKQIVSTYPGILKSEDKYLQRIDSGYIFRLSNTNKVMMPPTWVISNDAGDYFIPMMQKGG